MKAYRKTLPSGLRVITVPKDDSLSVTLLVLVHVGTNHEQATENGLSHFLEHMCFKGTVKRPTAFALSAELDSLGADYNAFTTREYTGYYVSCVPAKAEQALEIIADMYLNPTLAPAEIEKEKGVISEEINRTNDNPSRAVQEIFSRLLYGDNPFGRSILGTTKTLRHFTQADFLQYRRRYYTARNTVVIAAGAVRPAEMVKKIRQHFSLLSPGQPTKEPRLSGKQKKPAVLGQVKTLGQTNLALGFRSFGVFDRDYYPALVLASLLGGSMSSRLFQIVREEMGAAYSVSAYQTNYRDYGYFQIVTAVKKETTEAVIEVILEECRKLKTELVTPGELERVTDSLLGSLYLGLETPSDLAHYYGASEIIDEELLTPQAVGRLIKAVTPADLRRVARRLFVPAGLNIAWLGPHSLPAQFEQALYL